jgi:uncharacterized protein involved in exopolysaccharide biosynthesis
MHATTQTPLRSANELSLKEFIGILRSRKWFILLFTLAVTAGATTAAFLLPNTYKASVVVLPVAGGGSGTSSLSSLTSKVGGIASLFGISTGTDYKRTEAIAVLKSNALIRRYITEHNLIPTLYRSLWNASADRWKYPKHAPTLWDATRKFKKSIRTVTVHGKTGLVTVSVRWHNPEVAAKWANGLVRLTNDYLRDRAIKKATRDINYLDQEAQKTNVVELKKAIFTVLQHELEQSMLAQGTKEYAVTVIDPAVTAGRPISPDKKLWIAVGLFAGLLASCFIVLFKAALQ